MRTLYLHIGHSKTGSSYLQASFANSIAALAAHGVTYPDGSSKDAENWKISSGNGQALVYAEPTRHKIEGDKVFFSAEQMFAALAIGTEFRQKLKVMCQHYEISKIDILMFLRDPIPHAESSHQQMVKRGGSTGSIEDFFNGYVMPELVAKALNFALKDVEVKWHLFNYDRRKDDLLVLTERFLEVPEGTLVRGGDKPVNRSMKIGRAHG